MVTNGGSAETVSFVFTGIAVELVGAKRSNYGQYQITVNDKQYVARDGNNTPDLFQTSLFFLDWPATISRTVKMASIGNNKAVDLDFVSWTFAVGEATEEATISTFEENHPAFKYDSNDNWQVDPSNRTTYSGGTARVASSVGSSFEFTFEGDAVSLFGPVGPNGASYTVFTDTDGLPDDLSTRNPAFHPKTMLYHRSGLGPGTHKVRLSVGDGANENNTFAIDYAEVYTAPSLRGGGGGGSGSGLSKGAVAGIVAGGIIGLLLLIGLVLLVLARRGRKNGRTFYIGFVDSENDKLSSNDARPFQYTDASPPASPPHTGATSGDRLLQNQVSFTSLSSSPMTGQLSPNATIVTAATGYDSARPISAIGPNTQEIIVPPRGYEKSRVQLQPPPQGAARPRQTPAADGAAGQTVSPVTEEHAVDAPPPVYTQDNPTPAASSFYSR